MFPRRICIPFPRASDSRWKGTDTRCPRHKTDLSGRCWTLQRIPCISACRRPPTSRNRQANSRFGSDEESCQSGRFRHDHARFRPDSCRIQTTNRNRDHGRLVQSIAPCSILRPRIRSGPARPARGRESLRFSLSWKLECPSLLRSERAVFAARSVICTATSRWDSPS